MKKRNSRKTAVIAMGVVTALTMTACSMIPSAKASYISMDAAQSKALNAANVDAANVESYSAQMGDVGTTTCYEVQFVSDGYAYYYAVNATDGEIVKVTKTPVGEEPIQAQPEQTTDASASQTGETTPSTATGNQNNTATTKPTAGQTTTTPAANGQITLEQAKETALKHAGLKADAVTFVKAEQDYENGKLVYEVEFVTNDGGKVVEYDYEIDAATGSVVSYDYDAENYVSAKGATTVSVDEATAKQTVLNKVPGATAANIYEWKLDFDDGRWEYDGKIVYNLMEYDFTVDAQRIALRAHPDALGQRLLAQHLRNVIAEIARQTAHALYLQHGHCRHRRNDLFRDLNGTILHFLGEVLFIFCHNIASCAKYPILFSF